MKMGKFNRQQLWFAMAAFLATMGILFGGQALNAKFRVADPLKKDVLAIHGVKHFQFSEEKNQVKVELQLTKVANLQQVLEQVSQKVQQYHGLPVTQYRIADQPNVRLQTALYQLSFYLEEAETSGHYIQLKNQLDHMGSKIKARVFLSPKFTYIQLEDGAHYLYQAVPRPVRSVEKGIGGDSAG